MIRSDWHIHTECSYDATLSIPEIVRDGGELGITRFGITDHANFNDEKFLSDLRASAAYVKQMQAIYPRLVLGVELTPIEKPEFDHIAKHGTREGYVAPTQSEPFEIELAADRDMLILLGVRYAIGAAHWRVDLPNAKQLPPDLNESIREWHRQQMYLATDNRVTVLGHPWYHGKGLWYEDFSVIPRSMHLELAAALKENRKYVECNAHFFTKAKASERFRRQYAEFLRELFEEGIPVTYGSDSHKVYEQEIPTVISYLRAAGFREGDLCEIAEEDLW